MGRAVTLIALTGYGLADDQAHARAAGFDAHITKPATISMLEEAIAHAMDAQESEPRQALQKA